LIHRVGAFVPAAGMRAIPAALAWAMEQGGVELSYGQPVRRIRMRGAAAIGVETATGELVDSDAVVSNLGGAATYLGLLDVPPARIRSRLEAMPLQSPGVCAYLAVRDVRPGPYLRFRLPGGRELCRLLVTPAEAPARGWAAARLIGPMRHAEAEAMGAAGQQAYLERLLQEDWWRAGLGEARVVGRRVPAEWAAEFRLHRSAMNPVMTARLMRAGRLAHRSPYVRRLYLAGSSTHPGQWVSFCAISGILAADALHADFGGAAA
jgi:phytoene dehydrogenase-like protein